MHSPLVVNDKYQAEADLPQGKSSNIVALRASADRLLDEWSSVPALTKMQDDKWSASSGDNKAWDYVVILALSLVVHGIVVQVLKDMPLVKQELVKQEKPPSKVQISFYQPPPPKPVPPPPKPVVQKPPQPKVVPLKKPPKPKVAPKPVQEYVEAPVNTPVADAPPAPVVSAPPPPPPPPKVEKVTQPTAGAGYLNNPPPNYPDIAMERGWDGKVLLKVHVLASGKPDSVNVSKSSGHEVLDDEAVRTVKQWSFVPGKRGDTPIDGWVTVPITFNLQN